MAILGYGVIRFATKKSLNWLLFSQLCAFTHVLVSTLPHLHVLRVNSSLGSFWVSLTVCSFLLEMPVFLYLFICWFLFRIKEGLFILFNQKCFLWPLEAESRKKIYFNFKKINGCKLIVWSFWFKMSDMKDTFSWGKEWIIQKNIQNQLKRNTIVFTYVWKQMNKCNKIETKQTSGCHRQGDVVGGGGVDMGKIGEGD